MWAWESCRYVGGCNWKLYWKNNWKVLFIGESVKGNCCIYRGKVNYRNAEWRAKYLILNEVIEKLWCIQHVLKPSTKGCIAEIFFFKDRGMCRPSLVSISKLWALLSKKGMEQRRESWSEQLTGKLDGWEMCAVYKGEHNSLQTCKKLQRGKKLMFNTFSLNW